MPESSGRASYDTIKLIMREIGTLPTLMESLDDTIVFCIRFGGCICHFLIGATTAEAASLQGYWRLNETSIASPAVDSSGNLPPGTYAAGTDPTVAGPFAGFGTGADFPGGAGEINVGGGATLNFLNNFSVSGWMDLNNTSGKNSLIGNGTNGWGVRSSGTALQITTFGETDYTGTSGTLSATAGWQHVVVVLDASNDATFYVDGAPAGFVTNSDPANQGSLDFVIGAPASGNTSEDMDGSVDDLRFTHRR